MSFSSSKIPIKINPFFLILIALIGWINSNTLVGTLIWMAVIFISILVHEFGHALTAVFFGQTAEIELYGFGGMTRRRGPSLSLLKEFVIVFNGPLAGFILFFLSYEIGGALSGKEAGLFAYAIQISIYINLFWTVLNLLPVYPLDGGHLLRIILEAIFGVRGVKVAMFISMLVSIVIGVVFLKMGALLIGAIFFILTFESYRGWQSALSLTEFDRKTATQQRLKTAENERLKGNYPAALQQFMEIRKDAGSGVIFIAATECAAKILSDQSRFDEAYSLLKPSTKKLSQEGLSLLHQLTYHIGNWEEAISFGNRAFRYHPDYHTALINAFCHSILGQAKPAVGWLQTAMNQGMPNVKEVLLNREFDHIRDDPLFQNFLSQNEKG